MASVNLESQILGQLLLLQTSLQAAPSDKVLGEQICYVLKSIQGVTGIGFYLGDKLVADTIVDPVKCTAWPLTLTPMKELFSQEMGQEFHEISIQTTKKKYGKFVFSTKQSKTFSTYLPYIENTINMAALILENWDQEAELLKEKEFLQVVLDNVQDGIIACDENGLLSLFNKASRNIHGLEEKSIPPELWAEQYDLYLADGCTKMEKQDIPLFKAFCGGSIQKFEMVIAPKNRPRRIVQVSGQPLVDERKNLLGAVASMTDITEQKRAEDALRKVNDELEQRIESRTFALQQANARLEQEIVERKLVEDQLRHSHKMEAVGTLAGGIAHDFNNILAAILGYSEIAKYDLPAGHPARDSVNEVLKAGNRAKEIVKQIVLFSRKDVEDRVAVNLGEIIDETLIFIRSSIPTTIQIEKQINLQSGTILAEPGKMHQVLMNLCTNAAQAMEDDGGVLEVSLQTQTFTSETALTGSTPGDYVHLRVKDNGKGISEEHLGRIFDPYYTTKEVGKGSGMGLTVVAGIVRSYDGAITVENNADSGVTFNVYFPKHLDENHKEPVTIRDIKTGRGRVLVVDDEASIARLMQRRLQRLGYEADVETNSLNALENFKQQPNGFDLVITDYTMPNLTGEMLAKELRAVREDLPIIICTGYSAKMDAHRAEKAGIDAFIMKPVDIGELAHTVRHVLDKSAR